MSLLLSGRVAVITGASRGLGEAIALRFAREGASLALLSRSAASLESLLTQLRLVQAGEGQQFRPVPVDLADQNDLDHAARVCLGEFEGIDILVNNAATQGPIGPLESNDWAEWREAFELNLFAPARLSQLLVPSMRRQGGGKIINISGGGATSPRADFSSYAAAKCALVRLTETLAEELKPDQIDVNAVAPGAMNTRMLDEILAAGPDKASREFSGALKRKSEGGTSPANAAALVAMLASSLSDGISGRLISAVWDDWKNLPFEREALVNSARYTLRRVTRTTPPPEAAVRKAS